MKAELKRLHSPDLHDLEHSYPADVINFCILVQAMIAPQGVEGEESFDFLVCTPKRIAEIVAKDKKLFGRHYLIIERYDFNTIWREIEGLLNSVNGWSWEEIATHLNQYGQWEFDQYQPCLSID